jgi:hypothetical protein
MPKLQYHPLTRENGLFWMCILPQFRFIWVRLECSNLVKLCVSCMFRRVQNDHSSWLEKPRLAKSGQKVRNASSCPMCQTHISESPIMVNTRGMSVLQGYVGKCVCVRVCVRCSLCAAAHISLRAHFALRIVYFAFRASHVALRISRIALHTSRIAHIAHFAHIAHRTAVWSNG